MRLLMETWRNFLSEGMKTPDEIPEGYGIEVSKEQGGVFYFIYTKDGGKQWGGSADSGGPSGYVAVVKAKDMNYGDCLDGYYVKAADAASGWGPMLYDVAMEVASEVGGGLTPDRSSVSDSAQNVWNYYLGSRGDVQSHQLDLTDKDISAAEKFLKPPVKLQKLTPDIEEDDCLQTKTVRAHRDEWDQSSLSKRYTKAPTTMNALRAAGRLVEI